MTNTHDLETTTVTVTKAWVDGDNQDGIRPTEVTVQLCDADGNPLAENGQPVEITLNDSNQWRDDFTGLQKYDQGALIEYTVKEVEETAGYEASVSGSKNSYIITNTHTPETVSISGTKVWDDGDDQDGIRPESVTVYVLADGKPAIGEDEKPVTATATAEGDWKWSVEDLPKYSEGKEIVYTVTEDQVTGYEEPVITGDADSGFTITNTHTPETTSISGTKTWDDADNQDGIRPSSVTVNVLADGEAALDANGEPITATVTSDEKGNWAWSVENLPKNKSGKEIVYTVAEDAVTGYESQVSGNAADGFAITNTHTPETIDITGTKTWDDNDNNDGYRPTSITIRLLADGSPVKNADGNEITATVEQDANGNWTWTFTDLPKYNAGKEIKYTLTEDAVDHYATINNGYEPTDNGYSYALTNTHTPDQTSLTVTVAWDDSKNQDGIRPNSVTLKLLADGVDTGKKAELSSFNNWSYTITGLDIYVDEGKKVEYTFEEPEVPEGYTVSITGDAASGYTVTISHTPETVEIDVNKVWDDADDQDGRRPDTITVNLLADGKQVESAEVYPDRYSVWGWSFNNEPKYRDEGTEIEYTVTEDAVEAYSTDITGAMDSGFTITNTHTPEVIEISGSKTWDDDNNNDDERPESITIRLLADGSPATDESGNALTVTLTGDESDSAWGPWEIENLPKYDAGKEITYTVTEDAVTNYSTSYDGLDVTNTHSPEQTSLTVTAAWDDSKNQDGIRPESITVQLYADGTAVEGRTLELNESNNWTSTFTGLDIYEDEGKKVEYTVEEPEVPDGYTVSITGEASTGYTVTNSHTPETVEIDVEKVWDDADDQDGMRPTEITVNLLADGKQVESAKVTADRYGEWGWNFNDVPKYRDEGTRIVYTVDEDATAGYESSVSGDAESGFTITNTHTPETVEIDVTKIWDDADDQDGKRPTEITVNLLADGTQVESVTVTPDIFGSWGWSFNDKPKYSEGKEIAYTVTEDSVADYDEPVITGDVENGYTITNTHTPEVIEISGTKTWDDDDNNDGVRPASIMIRLLADGSPALDSNGEEITQTVTPDASGNWAWSFTDLPKYSAGKVITYSITEDAVDDYSTEYDSYDVTNTHTPDQTSLTVTAAWDDSSNQDGIRPASIILKLLADGEDTGIEAALSASNNWTSSFTGLNIYKDGGETIVYTLEEADVPDGYTVSITGDASTGYTVTNSHTPATVSVSGSKTWDDDNDNDGDRPESVTIRLLADGSAAKDADGNAITSVVKPDADGNWSWSFTDLPKYRDEGTQIAYTITEDAVANYSTAYNGYDVTNTHTPAQTSVTVTKVWDDANDQDGIRPESVTVKLMKDGADTGQTLVLSASNNWQGSFTGLDIYEDEGKTVSYTVEEAEVPEGYTTALTGDSTTGYVITNFHTPETIDIPGTKTWDDYDNDDRLRPVSITIRLKADGVEVDSVSVKRGDDDNWTWTFTDMPKYSAGKEIKYTITEDAIDDYSASYNNAGDEVINTHSLDQTSVTVSLNFNDADDQDGLRPASITLRLLADGEDTGRTVVLSASNNWTAVFTGLDINVDGSKVTYTVEEEDVPDGYTVSISGNATVGYTVTDTHTPATVSVSGSKTWDDDDNNDGDRPASITIRLLADGSPAKDADGKAITAVVTPDADGNWSWSFTDLPKYEDEGIEIAYTITEDAVAQYSTAYNGYDVTNTHTPDQTSLTVTKAWDDKNDQDGIRPESVTVKLLADGEDTGKAVVLSASDNWQGSFTGLDIYEDEGKTVSYTVEETSVPEGYTMAVTGDATAGYTITNAHTPETIDIPGVKTWDDDDNNDGDRPESITIRLLADGVDADSLYVAPDEDGNWTWSFKDVPKYSAGKEITYTVTEDAVDHYATGYDSAYDEVINIHTPDQTSLTVSVTFDDQDDRDGLRPDSITLKLFADGEDTGRTIEIGASDNWRGTFTGLEMYHDEGVRIQYTVEAVDVEDGYDVSVTGTAATGFKVTFTHKVETAQIAGSKTWIDDNNNDGDRPESITIRLYADGSPAVDENGNAASVTVTPDENGDWSWSFTGYDKYKDGGTEIAYTITEDAVDNYSTVINGYDVTNTHTPDQTSLTVTKVWDDANDQDGVRPESVTVDLLADGEDTGESLTLDASVGWTVTFTGIDMYRDEGTKIVYSVEEKSVPDGYVVSDISGDQTTGYTITNTHDPETVEVSGSKTWDDDDDYYGMRPDSITINLMADGEPAVDETAEPIAMTVTEADGWAWSFTGLPKYRDGGVEIVYTITEDEVYAYTSEVNGYDVTNTINPAEFVTGPGPASGNPDTGNPTGGNPNHTKGGKTGDNDMFYFWVILMCAAAALAVTGVTLRTRPKMR